MIILTSIVGCCVAVSLIWIMFIVSCLVSGRVDGSFLVMLMGLFLPLVVIGFGLGFVYIFTEMKKTQLLLRQALKKHTEQKETQSVPEIEIKEQNGKKPVLKVSMDDPIKKYENVVLPDDVDIQFER